MKTKIQSGLLFVISLISTGLGWYFGDPIGYGLCRLHDTGCGNFYALTLGSPIFFFSVSVLITSFILFFVREDVYKSWRRFAYWAIPISAILLWVAPTSGPGGIGISYLNYTKESASWLVSCAFLAISLWVIVSRSISRPS